MTHIKVRLRLETLVNEPAHLTLLNVLHPPLSLVCFYKRSSATFNFYTMLCVLNVRSGYFDLNWAVGSEFVLRIVHTVLSASDK